MPKSDYIRNVLDAYRRTPGITGTVRRNDRLLAAALYDRGVSLRAVENALVLAGGRRVVRPPDARPLQPVRSFAYILPVIDEVLATHVSQDYYRYVRYKVDQVLKNEHE